jgi:flagellar L-ring protein FlgH
MARMSKFAFVMVFLLIPAEILHSQDLRENLARSLFSDQKANHVGDAVTILIFESSSASNSAQSSTSRESALGLSGSAQTSATPSPNTALNLGTTNTFKGQGATQSNGSLQAKISAKVDSLLPNGNMYISGSRLITINGEDQLISIAGIIRLSDVQGDNSVYSYNISDARIVFQGNGMIDRAQSPGWFTKLFHWLF